MKMLLPLVALVTLGIVIQTQGATNGSKKDERLWRKAVSKTYDLRSLHGFLTEYVRIKPSLQISREQAAVWRLDLRVGRSRVSVFPAHLDIQRRDLPNNLRLHSPEVHSPAVPEGISNKVQSNQEGAPYTKHLCWF